MKKHLTTICIALFVLTALIFTGCQAGASAPSSPVDLQIWTYYNSEQLSAFKTLVDAFNNGQGKSSGIHVSVSNLGSVEDLSDALLDSANGRVGALALPHMVSAYADTAYMLDQMHLLADLGAYLGEDERARYVDSYWEEGRFDDSESYKIFPVAKSTEVLLLNETAFAPFASSCGVSHEDLRTMEGLVRVAALYYDWTDAQTETPHDGKAFFGRDAMANYLFVGAKQLGTELVTVEDGAVTLHFEKELVRKLWDHYYIPFVQGHFAAAGRYRSDDIKTGEIIALVGSSASATYFPTEVFTNSGAAEPAEMVALPAPQFSAGLPTAVQQGAGMIVIDHSDKETAASVAFLKWFTQTENNLQFSVSSGYLPVLRETAEDEANENLPDKRLEEVLHVALQTVRDNALYTPPVFENGVLFRSALERCMSDAAKQDAQAIQDAVAKGASPEEAVAQYLTDDNFDKWYTETRDELISILQ